MLRRNSESGNISDFLYYSLKTGPGHLIRFLYPAGSHIVREQILAQKAARRAQSVGPGALASESGMQCPPTFPSTPRLFLFECPMWRFGLRALSSAGQNCS